MFDENSVALVDADSIYFRVACVTKNKKDIRQSIKRTLNQIKRDCMANHMLIAVKGKGNFRQDIYPDYKANRKELDDDLSEALDYGRNYMLDELGATPADGMEADDLVSIWAYEAMDMEREYVVVGIDKDLRQIPGHHYNFVKSHLDYVDADAANYNLMLQCLTGDSTDNIPGIRGVGPKKASAILFGVPMQRRWTRVRAAWKFHKAGDPTTSRRLLEMLTSWKEYDNLRTKITGETSERERNVSEKQTQDSSVQELSDGDS